MRIQIALDAIEDLVGPIARFRIEQKLRDLLPFERQTFEDSLTRLENLVASWWFESTRQTGRAWLLARLSSMWIGALGWTQPEKPGDDLQNLLVEINQLSAEQLKSQLVDLLSGRGTLASIEQAQTDPSRDAWDPSFFSDPVSHDTQSFRYIIHAMRPATGLGAPSQDQAARFQYLASSLGPYLIRPAVGAGHWELQAAAYYLNDPSVLATELLSCSIIDPTHTKTYGNFSFGFVIQAPKKNICFASPRDAAVSNGTGRADLLQLEPSPVAKLSKAGAFLEGIYRHTLDSPQTILAQSSGHNEVGVLGSLAGHSPVKVTAIFIKVMPSGKVWKSFVQDAGKTGLFELILKCSERLNIPIIAIPDPVGEASHIEFEALIQGSSGNKLSLFPKLEEQQPISPDSEPNANSNAAPPPLALKPGDKVRFLQRIQPHTYCIATVLDASQPPIFNGTLQWPGHVPDQQTPGQAATFLTYAYANPNVSNEKVVRVWVRCHSVESGGDPSAIGSLFSPRLDSLERVG